MIWVFPILKTQILFLPQGHNETLYWAERNPGNSILIIQHSFHCIVVGATCLINSIYSDNLFLFLPARIQLDKTNLLQGMKQGKEQCSKNKDARVLVLALKRTPLCQPDTCDFPEHRFPYLQNWPREKTDRAWE